MRDSLEQDLPAIHAIYRHHVLHGTASFELDPPDLAEITRRRAEVLRNRFPYLVGELDGEVLGYAYANLFRTRPAYRYTLEDSIYIDQSAVGRGLGRALLRELLARCEALGCRQMLAVIGDSANVASIGLHAACGFRFSGVIRASGWKFGRWIDTVLMQCDLGPGHSSPPAEP
ncbi:MAG: GNAT family N-acetyltransferase [Quisquiliibacterium sp.]